MKDRNKIETGLKWLGINYEENQIDQLMAYYELLIAWNEKINLTAITMFDDVVLKHFIDSLALVKIKDMTEVKTLIDVGTGAGFPGIPIKIMFPHLKVTLIDSLNKRVKFLDEVIQELELSLIETSHGRAEDLGHQLIFREKYDVCVSRAVANLATLTEYCLPFVALNGSFISYKAGEVEEEVDAATRAIRVLGGAMEEVKYINLNNTDIKRTLVQVKKVKVTPKQYPRKAGKPNKEPIK